MPDDRVRRRPGKEATVYRRTTIAAAATALALLGGGSALAANAGLFGGDRPDGAGTLPAVSTLDTGTAGDDAAPSSPPTTGIAPAPADTHESSEHESTESAEVEDDD
jgi:hypothetical protein